jgi:D-threo-aldose 1-dehydrogenase
VDAGVARIGLGTSSIGGLYRPVDEATAVATIERAYERGIRVFDTAPPYGNGLSERRLGKVLSSKPRDEFVLATKVGRLLRADAPADPNTVFFGVPPENPVIDFSFDGVLRSIDESLERLGLDRIDIAHIHDPESHYEEALSGAYPALERLRDEGVIRWLGAGMNQVEMLERLAVETDLDFFLVAGRYTLLDQSALPRLLPLCVERRIGVVIGGVYNSGILVDPVPGATFNYRLAAPSWLERAQRLQEVCAAYDVPLMAAALQFPLAHPAVETVLLGVRSPGNLDAGLDALAVEIPAELWSDLRAAELLPESAPTPL